MADQGSIGIYADTTEVPVGQGANPLFGAATQSFAISQASTISGTVSEAGTAIAGAIVYLHQRSSGMPLARAISKADGTFSFTNCRASSADHYVVALDRDGGTSYNAIIFDKLTPV